MAAVKNLNEKFIYDFMTDRNDRNRMVQLFWFMQIEGSKIMERKCYVLLIIIWIVYIYHTIKLEWLQTLTPWVLFLIIPSETRVRAPTYARRKKRQEAPRFIGMYLEQQGQSS